MYLTYLKSPLCKYLSLKAKIIEDKWTKRTQKAINQNFFLKNLLEVFFKYVTTRTSLIHNYTINIIVFHTGLVKLENPLNNKRKEICSVIIIFYCAKQKYFLFV